MAPAIISLAMPLSNRALADKPTKASYTTDDLTLEAWGEGYHVGSLVILLLIVLCNYRRHVLLHKLILLELFFALWHGTFIFCQDPTYGWYLSSTATLLFISYQLHNIISWRKIKPFLPRWGQLTFIFTIIAVQPFWIVEAWNNFEYFNGLGNLSNIQTRPWEALARDPWWIFTTIKLIQVIKKDYGFTLLGLIRTSPRFAIMIFCMLLSLVFLIMDIIVTVTGMSRNSGINPYWRLALVFKCASDTIFLDDFKIVLDHIVSVSFSRFGGSLGGRIDASHHRPSFNPAPPSSTTLRNMIPPVVPGGGPIITIHSDNDPAAGGNNSADKTHSRKPKSWRLQIPIASLSKPKLQIRQETTITTTNEPSDRTDMAPSVSHVSEDTFVTKPQTAKPGKKASSPSSLG
ncbi:hypothetical protein EPUS_03494 [Endocarpon pusillum Z07020]|uniref:Uncharacterized protein n=1 Tax=Endocarpon pusillum (strain Z07020 / HMAS-L-300199) TaxID=1263415 RepID=U1HM24_ENDPU|nr:uncharacterized protein EPUS_03494 [Endocarpon pusillum Z07020]ERF71340.1 hypothetical protein EPUS_03494 [Endocarpon pusillum Z07020]